MKVKYKRTETFAPLRCYLAQIGSYRRFGTTNRSPTKIKQSNKNAASNYVHSYTTNGVGAVTGSKKTYRPIGLVGRD